MPGVRPWGDAVAPAVMPSPQRGVLRVVVMWLVMVCVTVGVVRKSVSESRRGSMPLTTARKVESEYTRLTAWSVMLSVSRAVVVTVRDATVS